MQMRPIVLRTVSPNTDPAESVATAGASGYDKTTLVKLIHVA